jgi:hypothetical protein
MQHDAQRRHDRPQPASTAVTAPTASSARTATVPGVRTLDRRTLNRTMLERQWLLRRHSAPALAAVRHLVGLQAQEPLEPYTGLWSRLTDFRPAELVGLLEQRRAVRTLMMRRTLHLLSSDDCRALRPIHDTMVVQRVAAVVSQWLPGVDLGELAAAGEPLFAAEPRTTGEVARLVAHRWPAATTTALGNALSTVVPLVQVPPRGVWGRTGAARCTTIEAWLGDGTPAEPATLDDLVLRYLAAFGPATSSDVRAWSGLAGVPQAVARLGPSLVRYRDERGRVLLDRADAALADADVPAPVRFLPAFDNAVLGYHDRSRIIDDEHRGLSVLGTRYVLVDGRVAAAWTTADRGDGSVEVTVRPLRPLIRAVRADVLAEAERLASFLGSGQAGAASVTEHA